VVSSRYAAAAATRTRTRRSFSSSMAAASNTGGRWNSERRRRDWCAQSYPRPQPPPNQVHQYISPLPCVCFCLWGPCSSPSPCRWFHECTACMCMYICIYMYLYNPTHLHVVGAKEARHEASQCVAANERGVRVDTYPIAHIIQPTQRHCIKNV
jgi:hypothetical protein